jgi:hypothetical protein
MSAGVRKPSRDLTNRVGFADGGGYAEGTPPSPESSAVEHHPEGGTAVLDGGGPPDWLLAELAGDDDGGPVGWEPAAGLE